MCVLAATHEQICLPHGTALDTRNMQAADIIPAALWSREVDPIFVVCHCKNVCILSTMHAWPAASVEAHHLHHFFSEG
jgi:hypothetical protein